MELTNTRFFTIPKLGLYLFFMLLCLTQAKAQKTILLDCLDLNKMYQGSSRPQVTSEHANLSVHKRKFMNGVHTRTESLLYVELDGRVTLFSGEVGVDDRGTSFRQDTVNKEHSTAEFFVIGDDKVLWSSGKMKYGDDSKTVSANLTGVKSLVLKITGGPGNTHVDWSDAKFTYSGNAPKAAWSPEDQVLIQKNLDFIKQQNNKYPTPRINGAMRVGIRPNTPIYYPMAVTGMRPVKFAAEGLPVGLVLNAETGIITGRTNVPGEHKIILKASNSHGKTERTLKLIVGDALALTPPMGFQSWNVVEGLIGETFIKELADTYVDFGFRDVGYQYINMDDCWQAGRDAQGNILADPYRFPNGMKAVSDYLHQKGLKFGIYSSPGPVTCAGYTGTLNFEEQDVKTWTDWGFDYLKYDGCSVPQDREMQLYKQMGNLLKTTGRSIVYCGRKEAGSQLWRIGGDLRDQWSIASHDVGILQSFEKAQQNARTQTPGGWVDPDMLVVGIYGKGSSGNDKTDEKGCTDVEYRSHMSLWCLMSAPLFMTADLRHTTTASLETLTNPEVIDVNQDPLGNFPVRIGEAGELEVWVKQMEDGSKTVALFNKSASQKEMSVKLADINLSGEHPVRDLWLRRDMGKFKNSYNCNVVSHGVTLIRIY